MINDTAYIDRYPNLTVNLNVLLKEFYNVQNNLEDVTNHGNSVLVQKKYHLLKCNEVMVDFNNFSYTKQIADKLKQTFDYNSITYRSIQPNTAYNWHYDEGSICYHIPLITSPGCLFVYENRSFYMPADGSVYIVNNSKMHTFVNASSNPRVHLTFEILQ